MTKRRSRAASESRDTTAGASALYRSIWQVVARIPRGRVATYGQIAALAGRPGQPRLAGYALRCSPDGANIPWHRVVNALGRISARAPSLLGGEGNLQRTLLEEEGVRFDAAGRIDLARYRWRPRGRSASEAKRAGPAVARDLPRRGRSR